MKLIKMKGSVELSQYELLCLMDLFLYPELSKLNAEIESGRGDEFDVIERDIYQSILLRFKEETNRQVKEWENLPKED